jgi:hypothetical protein
MIVSHTTVALGSSAKVSLLNGTQLGKWNVKLKIEDNNSSVTLGGEATLQAIYAALRERFELNSPKLLA